MTYLAKACWSEFMLKCLAAPKGVHALVTSEKRKVRWLDCRPESQIATRAPTAVSSRKEPTRPTRLSAVLGTCQ